MSDAPASPAMTVSLEYQRILPDGAPGGGGEAEAVLDAESLSVTPAFGQPFRIAHREIADLNAADYRVELGLASGERLAFRALGLRYEDFARELALFRSEMILADMLVRESPVSPPFTAYYQRTADGRAAEEGDGRVRLYETSLVVLPQRAVPWKASFSLVEAVEPQDYALRLTTELGEELRLSQLGYAFEDFGRALSEAMNALARKGQAALREMLPNVADASLRAAAPFLKDGKAVPQALLERIAPGLWPALESKVEAAGLKEEYAFLRGGAREGQMRIGLKRGLLGELTGEFLWFLAPFYGLDRSRSGNVVALESVTEEGGGGATYFFRLMDPARYAAAQSVEELDQLADRALRRLDAALLSLDFRREPIYLPDQRLLEPAYLKYFYAVQRLPLLRELRAAFLGRVVHSSLEQWQRGVTKILEEAK